MASSIRLDVSFDLRLLPAAVALAEELHFGRAASRLHLVQSALSGQISRLEAQLGVELFSRSTRKVELTPAGHVFLEGARTALRAAERAATESRRAGHERAGLRLAIDVDIPDDIIRHARRFGSVIPDARLRVAVVQQDDALARLGSADADLALIWVGAPDHHDVETESLTTIGIWAVVNEDEAVIGPDELLDVDDARRMQLAMYRPTSDTRAFYDQFIAHLTDGDGRSPDVVHVDVLDDAQYEMCRRVLTDGGFTITTEGDVDHLPSGLTAVPFDPAFSTTIALCWPRGTRHPLADRFLRHVNGLRRRPGATASAGAERSRAARGR